MDGVDSVDNQIHARNLRSLAWDRDTWRPRPIPGYSASDDDESFEGLILNNSGSRVVFKR